MSASEPAAGWSGSQRLCLITLALLLLVGCTGNVGPLPPLPDLHLPGVTQIPGITNLHALPQQGDIQDVATYQPAGQTTARVLFTLDSDLYSVGIDGSDLQSLQITCDDVAVSPDSRWAVCPHGDVHGDTYLAVISLTATPPQTTQLLTLPTAPFTGSPYWGMPTWLPDNHHVAVVTGLDGGCSVAIYTLSAAYDQVQMAGLLTFPMFGPRSGVNGCAVATLSGSPDGAWLAFIGETDPRFTLYALSVADAVAALLRSTVPLSLQVSTDQLIPLGKPYLTAPDWSGQAGDWRLTFIGDYGQQQLIQVDLTTRQPHTLLEVQQGQVATAAWTPDGKHLVFANGLLPCLECQPSYTPSHLYVYTPPA